MDRNFSSLQLPPYHLIEVPEDGLYVFFPERDCAFRVERVTYDLLEKALSCSLEDAAAHLVRDGYPEEAVTTTLADALRLRKAGFMDGPVSRIPESIREQGLQKWFNYPRTRLELALAESCNLACTYCYCSAVRDMPNKGLMSEGIARQAVDWLFRVSRDAKDLTISLFGGEPLTNKPVFKFVMDYSDVLAKEHGKTITYIMTTNGTLLDDMVIDYIKKHDFGLMVSLDGPPEIHDAQCPTRDGGPSFELATRGIKKLMSRRRRVTVRCTMTHSRPNMLNLIKFFEDFGFSRIVLAQARNPVAPTPVDCTQEDLIAFEQQNRAEVLPWALDEIRRGRIPAYFPYGCLVTDYKPDPGTKKTLCMFKCGACRGTMTVGADGTLYPCHRFLGMTNFTIGHVTEGPDTERCINFWRSYDAAVDVECAKCWARWRCNRPCPWGVANSDGSFRRPDTELCVGIRRAFEGAISLQWRLCNEFPDLEKTLCGT